MHRHEPGNIVRSLVRVLRNYIAPGTVAAGTLMFFGLWLLPATGSAWITFPDFWPFKQERLQLEPNFQTYQPERRTGVSTINIEQSRVVRYFGFRNVTTTDQQIELDEIRRLGGERGEVNEIRLVIRDGRIARKPIVRGTKNPRVDRYLITTVNSWQGSDPRFPVVRFTDFIDLADMVIKLDQGGKVRVIYHNIEVSQPEEPALRYKFFNYISRTPVDIHYVLPLEGFNVTQVSATGPADEKFDRLRVAMNRWMNMDPPDVTSL